MCKRRRIIKVSRVVRRWWCSAWSWTRGYCGCGWTNEIVRRRSTLTVTSPRFRMTGCMFSISSTDILGHLQDWSQWGISTYKSYVKTSRGIFSIFWKARTSVCSVSLEYFSHWLCIKLCRFEIMRLTWETLYIFNYSSNKGNGYISGKMKKTRSQPVLMWNNLWDDGYNSLEIKKGPLTANTTGKLSRRRWYATASTMTASTIGGRRVDRFSHHDCLITLVLARSVVISFSFFFFLLNESLQFSL